MNGRRSGFRLTAVSPRLNHSPGHRGSGTAPMSSMFNQYSHSDLGGLSRCIGNKPRVIAVLPLHGLILAPL